MLAFSKTQHDLFTSDASHSMHDAESCLATASLASPLLTCCTEQSSSKLPREQAAAAVDLVCPQTLMHGESNVPGGLQSGE